MVFFLWKIYLMMNRNKSKLNWIYLIDLWCVMFSLITETEVLKFSLRSTRISVIEERT